MTDRNDVLRDFTWYDPTGFLFTDSQYHYWFERSDADTDVRPDMTMAWYETPPTAAPFATSNGNTTTPAALPDDEGGVPPKTTTLITSGGNSLRTATAFNGLVRKSYLFKAAGKLNGKVQRIEEVWEGKTVETFRAAYDANTGRLLRAFDADGNVTEYEYVTRDEVSPFAPEEKVTVTDPLGNSTEIEKDIQGNVTKVTDPSGVVIELTYDARNRVTEIRNTTNDLVGTLTYNERDDIIAATDGTGATWEFTFQDFHGRSLLTEAESPTGLTYTRTYDAAGRLVSSDDPGGNGDTYAWNAENLIESVTDALGDATDFAYDAEANLVTTTYADATTASATYDRRGIVETETDPNGHSLAYEIGPDGWLAKLIDERGKETTWDPHGNNGTDEKTYANGTKDEYTYDDRGFLTGFKHRSGTAEIDLAYDEAGHLTQRAWGHDGTFGVATYDRDEAGRLIASEASASTWPTGLSLAQSYTYDANGQLASASQNGRTIAVARDAAGRITKLTYPGGMEIDYEFDADGKIAAIKKDGATLAAYTYDAAGRRATRALANGVTTTYGYDAASQLLDIHVTDNSNNTLTRHSYAYNNVGERTTRTEILPGFGTSQETFGYDNAGQLITAAYQQPQPGAGVGGGNLSAASYTFDPAGNRTQITRDAAPLAYAVNDVNQYTQVGGDAQIYNSRGDLVSHNGWALTYNADGNLVTAVDGGVSPTVLHYLYDGGGRRVGRSESDGGGGWDTEWFLQLGVQVVEARNPVTGATSYFVYEPGLDQPLCRVDGATGNLAHFFHQDALGSVTALTDTSGAVAESYRYTEWGKPSVYDGSGVLQTAGTPAQSTFLFTGREYETATGLAHHRNRTYSPVLGRWASPDPLEIVTGDVPELLAEGPNLYSYVVNSPVIYFDNHGLQTGRNGGANRRGGKQRVTTTDGGTRADGKAASEVRNRHSGDQKTPKAPPKAPPATPLQPGIGSEFERNNPGTTGQGAPGTSGGQDVKGDWKSRFKGNPFRGKVFTPLDPFYLYDLFKNSGGNDYYPGPYFPYCS